MSVTQLSVFIENKTGRIAEIAETLAAANLNIRGFSVSDTEQYGIVRVIVDDPKRGLQVLKDAKFTVTETPVIVINLSGDRPGLLADVLRTVSESGVNVEYIYSLVSTLLAINVTDVEEAEKLLANTSVEMLDIEAIRNIG